MINNKKYRESIFPIVIIFISGIMLYFSEKMEIIRLMRGQILGPRFFPRAISIIMIFLCVLLFISNIRKISGSQKTNRGDNIDIPREYNNVILFSIFMIFYIGSMRYLGFFLSTFLYLLTAIWSFSKKDIKSFFLSLIISLIFIGFIFLFFVTILEKTLPNGMIFS